MIIEHHARWLAFYKTNNQIWNLKLRNFNGYATYKYGINSSNKINAKSQKKIAKIPDEA